MEQIIKSPFAAGQLDVIDAAVDDSSGEHLAIGTLLEDCDAFILPLLFQQLPRSSGEVLDSIRIYLIRIAPAPDWYVFGTDRVRVKTDATTPNLKGARTVADFTKYCLWLSPIANEHQRDFVDIRWKEYAKEAGWRILLFPKLNMGYWPFPDTEMEAHFLLDHTDYLGHTIPSGNGVDLFSAYDALYLSNECKSGKVTRVWEVGFDGRIFACSDRLCRQNVKLVPYNLLGSAEHFAGFISIVDTWRRLVFEELKSIFESDSQINSDVSPELVDLATAFYKGDEVPEDLSRLPRCSPFGPQNYVINLGPSVPLDIAPGQIVPGLSDRAHVVHSWPLRDDSLVIFLQDVAISNYLEGLAKGDDTEAVLLPRSKPTPLPWFGGLKVKRNSAYVGTANDLKQWALRLRSRKVIQNDAAKAERQKKRRNAWHAKHQKVCGTAIMDMLVDVLKDPKLTGAQDEGKVLLITLGSKSVIPQPGGRLDGHGISEADDREVHNNDGDDPEEVSARDESGPMSDSDTQAMGSAMEVKDSEGTPTANNSLLIAAGLSSAKASQDSAGSAHTVSSSKKSSKETKGGKRSQSTQQKADKKKARRKAASQIKASSQIVPTASSDFDTKLSGGNSDTPASLPEHPAQSSDGIASALPGGSLPDLQTAQLQRVVSAGATSIDTSSATQPGPAAKAFDYEKFEDDSQTSPWETVKARTIKPKGARKAVVGAKSTAVRTPPSQHQSSRTSQPAPESRFSAANTRFVSKPPTVTKSGMNKPQLVNVDDPKEFPPMPPTNTRFGQATSQSKLGSSSTAVSQVTGEKVSLDNKIDTGAVQPTGTTATDNSDPEDSDPEGIYNASPPRRNTLPTSNDTMIDVEDPHNASPQRSTRSSKTTGASSSIMPEDGGEKPVGHTTKIVPPMTAVQPFLESNAPKDVKVTSRPFDTPSTPGISMQPSPTLTNGGPESKSKKVKKSRGNIYRGEYQLKKNGSRSDQPPAATSNTPGSEIGDVTREVSMSSARHNVISPGSQKHPASTLPDRSFVDANIGSSTGNSGNNIVARTNIESTASTGYPAQEMSSVDCNSENAEELVDDLAWADLTTPVKSIPSKRRLSLPDMQDLGSDDEDINTVVRMPSIRRNSFATPSLEVPPMSPILGNDGTSVVSSEEYNGEPYLNAHGDQTTIFRRNAEMSPQSRPGHQHTSSLTINTEQINLPTAVQGSNNQIITPGNYGHGMHSHPMPTAGSAAQQSPTPWVAHRNPIYPGDNTAAPRVSYQNFLNRNSEAIPVYGASRLSAVIASTSHLRSHPVERHGGHVLSPIPEQMAPDGNARRNMGFECEFCKQTHNPTPGMPCYLCPLCGVGDQQVTFGHKYCSRACLLSDAYDHASECTQAPAVTTMSNTNLGPEYILEALPIKSLNQTDSREKYRQRMYSMFGKFGDVPDIFAAHQRKEPTVDWSYSLPPYAKMQNGDYHIFKSSPSGNGRFMTRANSICTMKFSHVDGIKMFVTRALNVLFLENDHSIATALYRVIRHFLADKESFPQYNALEQKHIVLAEFSQQFAYEFKLWTEGIDRDSPCVDWRAIIQAAEAKLNWWESNAFILGLWNHRAAVNV